MIISLAKLNKGKRDKLKEIYNKGLELTKKYIDIVWKTKVGKFAEKEVYNKLVYPEITATFKQLCCKNAIAIVKAIHNKQEKRLFIYNQLITEKKIENANRLKSIIDKVWEKKPEIKDFSLNLSGLCVKINTNSEKTKHKNWIHIRRIFSGKTLDIPFIKTKPFNKYDKIGKMSQFLQITKDYLAKVIFKIVKPEKILYGSTLGVDIGINNVYTTSKLGTIDTISPVAKTGYKNLVEIYQQICKTKENSIQCRKKRTQAINYINWSINQINWRNIKNVVMEDLKNVKFKRKIGRFLRCWRYPKIIQKFESKCEELGLKMVKVAPQYTSMRCSHCGWVERGNRTKTIFRCNKCPFVRDADINAARNISSMKKDEIIKGDPEIGFYHKRTRNIWSVNRSLFEASISRYQMRSIN